MSIFSWFMGGGDTVDKALDIAGTALQGIGTWIDDKDFTPEEKSKALAKTVDSHLKLVELTNSENSIRSITRRYLAWGICLYMLTWATVAMVFAILDQILVVERMMLVVDAFKMGFAFSAVVTLYFGIGFFRK